MKVVNKSIDKLAISVVFLCVMISLLVILTLLPLEIVHKRAHLRVLWDE